MMGPLLLCLWGLLGRGAGAAWAADPRHLGGSPQGDYSTSPYPYRSPMPLEQEAGVPSPLPLIPPQQAEDGPKDPWRSNWCPYQQSKLVTFVASCKTEKFLVHSQQPCPPGTPDCQKVKVMYRVSLKPVYQVKQKVHKSMVWKCCPGYSGADCKHYDPSGISEVDDQSKKKQDPGEEALKYETVPPSSQPMELRRAIEQQEDLLEDLQNDIHQATGNLLDLQKSLESNYTAEEIEANLTELGSADPSLQQALPSQLETFLKSHFSPVWRSFNESLLKLSETVTNLSRAVETNRRDIERLRETAAPKADLQELGTKFESKVQENTARVHQLRQDVEGRLRDQQLALTHNLSAVRADTDLKVKKLQKAQEAHLLLSNGSAADSKEEQEDTQVKLRLLQSNLSELWGASGRREEELLSALRQLNETLAKHEEDIKELFIDSDENFELGTRLEGQVMSTERSGKTMMEELRVILMEKSLIMEEMKEDFERQILDLNYTLHHLQGSHSDLMKYVKDCNCQKLSFDLSLLREDQRNATRFLEETHLTLEDQKMLESSSIKALRNAAEDLAMSVDAQKEELARAKGSVALLKGQVQALAGEVDGLRRVDRHVFREIRYLNNSFSSLLEDALRHQLVLVTLFGEEALEEMAEEDARLSLTYVQMEDALEYTSSKLREHARDLKALGERVEVLESAGQAGPQDSGQPEAEVQSRAEHPEPNQEASDGAGLQENDLANLKSEITLLGVQMEKMESQMSHSQECCRPAGEPPLVPSVESLQRDVRAVKQDLGQHLQLFQGLFGNYGELVATNISLDLEKLWTILDKKGKKQRREEESHRKRDKKQVEKWGEQPFPENGRSDQAPKLLGEGPSVAFYAGFPQGTHGLRRPVKFNVTQLNLGDCYVPEHGYFRVPERGIYLIAVSAEFGPGLGEGQLVLGGRLRTSVSSGSQEPAAAGTTTAATFAVAELQKGERVWFELTKGSLARKNPSGTALGGFLVFKT
ncbi:multimerin-2 [Sarcophilus harrisii]|uniref:Multimerin 2 n=1 Tax=Sarcophilus harrisii TaxID=9305 RepID=G3VQB8_SARHA|nr:multimerin-2 [Sarcophilus harrisii]